jgi:hypothetical protein
LELLQLALKGGAGPPGTISLSTRTRQLFSLKINDMAGFSQPTFRLSNAALKLSPSNLRIGEFLAPCFNLHSQIDKGPLGII